MSQPSKSFNAATTNSFLPSIGQKQYNQAQLNELFGQDASDQPVFSSTNSKLLDDASLSHSSSSNTSRITTPTFFAYSFGRQASAYPYPDTHSAHPYPLEHQQTYQAHLHPAFGQRPLPIRAHTNSSFLLPSQPPQGYVRRRSLSHNDANRIAAAPPNPTFVRLQARRARSTTPEEKRRPGPYPKHGRSASQGPRPRGRSLKNPAYLLQGSPLGGDVLSTLIGTPIGMPLDEPVEVNRSRYHPGHTMYPSQNPLGPSIHCRYPDDPIIHHMGNPMQLAHSRRIIQIGAMTVRKHATLDPKPEEGTGTSGHECIMKKVEEVEQHLRNEGGDNEDALKGCAMIREVLRKRRMEIAISPIKSEDGGDDPLDAPSTVMKQDDEELFGGCLDENDHKSMLTKEDEHNDCGLEED